MAKKSKLTLLISFMMILFILFLYAQSPRFGESFNLIPENNFEEGQFESSFRNWISIYHSKHKNWTTKEMKKAAGNCASMGFSDVMLGVNMHMINTSYNYRNHCRTFVSLLHDYGLKAHAQIVSGQSALDDYKIIEDRVMSFYIFHSESGRNRKFDGVHVDIEPWAHPDWDSSHGYLPSMNNENMMIDYLNCLERLYAIKDYDSSLELSADMAYWINNKVENGLLYTGIPDDFLHYLDFITYMVYDDDHDDVTRKIEDEMNATSMSQSICVMVKTKDIGSDDETFWQEGWNVYKDNQAYIEQEYKDFDNYWGHGVYEYESALTLFLQENESAFTTK